MEYKNILVERKEPVVSITLNRPRKLNAMSLELIQELMDQFYQLRTDTDIRYVVFYGAGKAFSAGADVSMLDGETSGDRFNTLKTFKQGQYLGHDFMRLLENLDQITISAVDGYSLGAGLCIPMVCDFRIASGKALFGVPETGIGIFYTWGATPRLTALIGPAWAKEMIITNNYVTPEKALAIGLVQRIVASENLIEAVQELIETIESKGRIATSIAKKMINAAAAPNMGDLYVCEPEIEERLYLSDEPSEGVKAFIQKRPPKFKGR
ncbi:MAG: enoyl-CoA hydratase/isomerase family protein [Deltaproteobacteria bacterium]|nr:enoyl-CoA hydratase/isomerase family protein [Deltaproteobacteria bacterium]